MSNVVHRRGVKGEEETAAAEAAASNADEFLLAKSAAEMAADEKKKVEAGASEEEMEPLPSVPSGEGIGQDTGNVEVLDSALKDLNPRWRNWVVRGIFTWIMIFAFAFIVYLGPLAITILILGIQVKCFHEIITIGYYVYKSHHLPWFRTISWYFLVTSNYYLYGESLIEKFSYLLKRSDFLAPFVVYHRFISFSLYTAGFVAFVLTLKKTYYLKQFTLFGYTHLALLLIVTQSNLMIQNVFEGMIWFLLPVSLIICNDIMAYMFGFFYGKTQLIKLSPKKTWEGFIGGAFSTIVFSFILSAVLCNYQSFVCPLEYNDETQEISTNCEPIAIFRLKAYNLPRPFSYLMPNFQVYIHPFQLHALSLAIFASTIGPFGGFMDRFDCQVIMATFVNVYIYSFVRSPSPNKLFNQLLAFRPEDQAEFLRLINNHFNHSTINR